VSQATSALTIGSQIIGSLTAAYQTFGSQTIVAQTIGSKKPLFSVLFLFAAILTAPRINAHL
jgi:hypothetical protein